MHYKNLSIPTIKTVCNGACDICNCTAQLSPLESDKQQYHLPPDTLAGCCGLSSIRKNQLLAVKCDQTAKNDPHTHIAPLLSGQHDTNKEAFQHVTSRKQICISLITQDPGHCKALHLHRSQHPEKAKEIGGVSST